MREPLDKAENIRTKKIRNYDKGNDWIMELQSKERDLNSNMKLNVAI